MVFCLLVLSDCSAGRSKFWSSVAFPFGSIVQPEWQSLHSLPRVSVTICHEEKARELQITTSALAGSQPNQNSILWPKYSKQDVLKSCLCLCFSLGFPVVLKIFFKRISYILPLSHPSIDEFRAWCIPSFYIHSTLMRKLGLKDTGCYQELHGRVGCLGPR